MRRGDGESLPRQSLDARLKRTIAVAQTGREALDAHVSPLVYGP